MLRPVVWEKFTNVSEVFAAASETLVNLYQTTRHNNPEDSHLAAVRTWNLNTVTLVVTYLWVPRPLEVKGEGIRRLGGVADKEAHTVHTISIISQRQYFVARCLISCVGNVIGLRSIRGATQKFGEFEFYARTGCGMACHR
jgi:hypothetical protein